MRELSPEYDPDTLREVYPNRTVLTERIDELAKIVAAPEDEIGELLARGELVDLLRAAGRQAEARAEGERALRRAQEIGTAAQRHLAELRLARVVQWAGDFGTANAMFERLLAHATEFGPVIAAVSYQYAGTNRFDQHDFAAALELFGPALAIRQEFELTEDQVESDLAVRAARARLEGEQR